MGHARHATGGHFLPGLSVTAVFNGVPMLNSSYPGGLLLRSFTNRLLVLSPSGLVELHASHDSAFTTLLCEVI